MDRQKFNSIFVIAIVSLLLIGSAANAIAGKGPADKDVPPAHANTRTLT